jgi:signal transduction histidine kinase/CheY-like chemotaxis protein
VSARRNDQNRKALGLLGTITDITVRTTAEETLVSARNLAEAASRAKTDFLANMSHEIRTPMNAIVGMADLLADTPLTDEQHRYVGIFRQASATLLELINDILDVSKIEAGKLDLESIPVDLHTLLEDAAEVFTPRAAAKNVDLVVWVAPEVPARILADPTRLRQIIYNLLSNAIKFTDKGSVTLAATPSPDRPGGMRLSVADTGIGIAPEIQQAIFSGFTQADMSITRKYGGTGLGLTISSRLCALMGGRLQIQSTPGQGSTFFFDPTFPALEAALPLPRAAITGTALVLAASPSGGDVLSRLLGEQGWMAEHVPDVTELTERLPGRAVLIADMRVLTSDHLRALSPLLVRAQVRLLLLSEALGDMPDLLETGAVVLTKPIRRKDLAQALMLAGPLCAVPVKKDNPALNTGVAPYRLLLVEDNPDNRQLIHLFLKGEPVTIHEAHNGQVALDMVNSTPVDVVLMDLQMPVMDGLTATRTLRAQGCKLPIIALTANALKEDAQRCLEAGCTAYLSKPVTRGRLVATLREHLGR